MGWCLRFEPQRSGCSLRQPVRRVGILHPVALLTGSTAGMGDEWIDIASMPGLKPHLPRGRGGRRHGCWRRLWE